MDKKGEYQDVPAKSFRLIVPKISVAETFIVALSSGTENVWIRRRGAPTFSVENFLSQSAEKLPRGILYCCIKILLRKSLWPRRRKEYQDIPSKNFCVTVPKHSIG